MTRTDTNRRDASPRAAALTIEQAAYLAIFGLALALRLYGLGAHPLNDPEAREALAVLRFLRGGPELLPASPLYFFFTTLNFLVFQPGEWTARLAPAVLGALLALLPWFLRPALGRGPALAASALLAISSSLVAASRSADGTSLTVFALSLALAAGWRFAAGGAAGWGVTAAIALGAAVAGGGAFFTGLLIVGLIAVAAARTSLVEAVDWPALAGRWRQERLTLLTAFALTVVLTATVGLTYRAGLGALARSWLDWFLGFAVTAEGRSLLAAPVFLAVYEPLILLFGIVGVVRAFLRGEVAAQLLAGLAFIGLLFMLFYTGRTLFDTVWIVLPLALLAAKAGVESVQAWWAPDEWPLVAALSGILAALLTFAAINVTRHVDAARFSAALQQADLIAVLTGAPNLVLAGLALVVAGLVAYLFGAGWSPRAAGAAVTLTAAAALLLATLGAGWGLAQLRPTEPVELWWERPTADDLRRLTETLTDISNFSVGQENEIAVTVRAEPDGALAWALRDFTRAEFVSELSAFIQSPVVIAPEAEQNPALGSAYLGQAFTIRRFWFPENLFWHEQLDWLVFRRTPTLAERVILWVRQDVQQLQPAGQP